MASRFRKQASYWFPSRANLHLHISLTNPARNPDTNENSVLAVHITDRQSGRGSRRLKKIPVVILQKGDDPRIKKPSRVVYEKTQIIPISKLDKKALHAQQLHSKAFTKVTRGLDEYLGGMSSQAKLRRFFTMAQ